MVFNKKMDTLAKRVKFRRKTLKLTQDKVAELSGLKQPDISKIELGRIQQTTEILGLARALKCNPDWLESETGPMEIGRATGALALSAPIAAPAQETTPVAMSAECQVMCTAFAELRNDQKSSVLTGILNLIQEAREPPNELKQGARASG